MFGGAVMGAAAALFGRIMGFFSAKVLAWALVTALAFSAVQTVRISGFSLWFIKVEGLAAKVERLADERDKAVQAAKDSERMRVTEQVQDKQSFGDAAERCTDRVADAFDAGVAIGEIVNGGTGAGASEGNGTGGAGAGRPVSADQLRRIIGQGRG